MINISGAAVVSGTGVTCGLVTIKDPSMFVTSEKPVYISAKTEYGTTTDIIASNTIFLIPPGTKIYKIEKEQSNSNEKE